MFLALTPHAADIWILIAAVAFLAATACFCLLVRRTKPAGIPIDDHADEEQTLTDASFRKNRTSDSRQEIFDGMAKVCVSGSHPALEPRRPAEEIPETGTKTSWTMWDGIADARSDKPAQPSETPKIAQETEAETAPESMIDRPDTCPFCGQDPTPDYRAMEAEGGVIYACPHCRCIVYTKPTDLVYKYAGQRYHVPEGKPFVPPDISRTEALRSMPVTSPDLTLNQEGQVVDLFGDIVD